MTFILIIYKRPTKCNACNNVLLHTLAMHFLLLHVFLNVILCSRVSCMLATVMCKYKAVTGHNQSKASTQYVTAAYTGALCCILRSTLYGVYTLSVYTVHCIVTGN